MTRTSSASCASWTSSRTAAGFGSALARAARATGSGTAHFGWDTGPCAPTASPPKSWLGNRAHQGIIETTLATSACASTRLTSKWSRRKLTRKGKRRVQEVLKRFLSKVSPCPITGCWWWMESHFSDGYPAFWWDGRTMRGHRASLLLHGVRLSPDQQALHRCDNPSCVNPEHLYPGSHRDNMTDLRQRGQAKGIPKTEEWKEKMRLVDPAKRRKAANIMWSNYRARLAQDGR